MYESSYKGWKHNTIRKWTKTDDSQEDPKFIRSLVFIILFPLYLHRVRERCLDVGREPPKVKNPRWIWKTMNIIIFHSTSLNHSTCFINVDISKQMLPVLISFLITAFNEHHRIARYNALCFRYPIHLILTPILWCRYNHFPNFIDENTTSREVK